MIKKEKPAPNTMYVHKATFALFGSFVIRANICMLIAAKLSQIALFPYIWSLSVIVKNDLQVFRAPNEESIF